MAASTTRSALARRACPRRYVPALLVVLGVSGACGGDTARQQRAEPRDETRDSVPATAPLEDSVATIDTVTGCPMWGLWRECSVAKRLERAGLVAQRRDEPEQHDFLSVPGIVFSTERTEIQVFLYPSGEARARDTDAVDSVTVSPRGRRIVWRAPAVLVTSGNLAAIILGFNEREVERAALALGAGLPPRPPR